VTTLSEIFQSRGNLVISLVVTGMVAVMFQPLRERIQKIVNHYIFGERNNPYVVISQLTERLEHNVSPKTLLPGIVETIAQTLKLSYVAIALKDGDQLRTDAVYGQPADQGRITELDLLYGQEVVGQLIIGQDAGDKHLNTSERQLLDNIARQTGIAAHAVQLTLALQHSRQQIVTAREEERRRLRRDLHDGIGPALAAHTIKVGAARLLLETDPQTAANILVELENNLSNSLVDIRRLVYNLRPPALDQLGLIGALSDFVQQCNGRTLFSLNTPEALSTLPAAVEVAAYRIVQEAINNVIRHAQAQKCKISITSGDELHIQIADDGRGLPADLRFGVGLNAIRERTEELGGQFTIGSVAPHGTQLDVSLPL
jgi:signal transduction histidine kinase